MVRAVRLAGSTREAGSTKGDQVQYGKDPTCSDVVTVMVSEARKQTCGCGL